MCELKVYLTQGNERVKVMDGVVRLIVAGDNVVLEGIFGEQKKVLGRLIEVSITSQEALVAGS